MWLHRAKGGAAQFFGRVSRGVCSQDADQLWRTLPNPVRNEAVSYES